VDGLVDAVLGVAVPERLGEVVEVEQRLGGTTSSVSRMLATLRRRSGR
jgi:hypothetical protein